MSSRMLERDESCRKGQSNSEKQHIWSTSTRTFTAFPFEGCFTSNFAINAPVPVVAHQLILSVIPLQFSWAQVVLSLSHLIARIRFLACACLIQQNEN